MKILFSPFSPYVRKCLVCAHELDLINKISLLPSNAHPVNRDQEIIKNNPLGKVPTFFTDDGQVIYDSRVICEYLNELAGGKLIPSNGLARWQALTLQALGDGMLDAALLARYEDVARPNNLRWPDWHTAQLDKCHTSLAHLEGDINLLTNKVNIGSLTIGCALWYLDLRFSNFDWRMKYPKVAQWFTEFSQRPSMKHSWALPEQI